jgi:hypothetical protein
MIKENEESNVEKNEENNVEIKEKNNKYNENEEINKYYNYSNEDLLNLNVQREKIGNKTILSEIWKKVGFTTELFRISLPSITLQVILCM